MYVAVVKRCIDFILSLIGSVVLLPVFLVLAVCIKVDSSGPVFFVQKRVGRGKTLFPIIKLRTMRADTPKDVPTHLLGNPNDKITKLGSFLRKYSLDELPQVFNILVGQMSIIGPRPALWNQEDLVQQRDQYGANAVRPGLTGYSQIHGRDELPIPEKAALDGYYVQNLTFSLDLKIFFQTVAKVFRGSGVREGSAPKDVDSHTN